MGIICAALLVYGNLGREGKLENPVPKDLRITELMQIEYKDADGKKHKFKPEAAEIEGKVYYIDHKEVIDAASGVSLYSENGKAINTVQGAPSFKATRCLRRWKCS